MIRLKHLVMLLFATGLIVPTFSLNHQSESTDIPHPRYAVNEPMSIEQAKQLSDGTSVTVVGSVISKLGDVYIADEYGGVGIQVIGIDKTLVKLKDLIEVSGVLSKSFWGLRTITDATLIRVKAANVLVKPSEYSKIDTYFDNYIGNVVKIKNLRYFDKLGKDSYLFKDEYNQDLNVMRMASTAIPQQCYYMDQVVGLKRDNQVLIQNDEYIVTAKDITGVLIKDNYTIKLSICETSTITFDYQKSIKQSLIMHKNIDNQCIEQFDIARTFILSSPQTEIDYFKESKLPGYDEMRARYQAWGKHLNKELWSFEDKQSASVQLNESLETSSSTDILIPLILFIIMIPLFFILKSIKVQNKNH